MKFDYSLNFPEQLHFSVGNTRVKERASVTLSCRESMHVIKNDEFQLEIRVRCCGFSSPGRWEKGCFTQATVAFEVFLELFQSCHQIDEGGFLSLKWLPPPFHDHTASTKHLPTCGGLCEGYKMSKTQRLPSESVRAEHVRLRLWTLLGYLWLGRGRRVCDTHAYSAVHNYGPGGTALYTLPVGIVLGKKGPHLNRYLTAQASKEDGANNTPTS